LPVIAVEVRLSSKPGATPISTAKSTIDAAPQTVHSTEAGAVFHQSQASSTADWRLLWNWRDHPPGSFIAPCAVV
jgi:hypothetical protein